MGHGILAELQERRAQQTLQFGIALAMKLLSNCLHSITENFSAGVCVEFDKLVQPSRRSFSRRCIGRAGAVRVLPQDLMRARFIASLLKFFYSLLNVSRRDVPTALGKQHRVTGAWRNGRPELAFRRISLRISGDFCA